MEYVLIAAISAQAISTIQGGQAQAQAMRLQARQSELQGRQNALAYNRQAIQVFERQQRLAGTIRARAAAAGVDPLTGSPMTMDQVNALAAGREMEIARENAEMAIYGGLAQSQSLQAAASFTQRQAITSALTNAALQAYGMSRTATPSAPGTLAPVETRTATSISAPVAAPVAAPTYNLSPSAPTLPYFPAGTPSVATSYPVR
jgi:hypothetical protein